MLPGMPRAASSIRILFADVDGTLVGTSGDVSPRVWDAARQARDEGIAIVLCSGRPAFGGTLDLARRLDPNGFHVFQNGASIVHLGTGESISKPISAPVVEQLITRARETHDFLELYEDSEFAFEGADHVAEEHARLLGIPFQKRPFSALKSPIVRAQWILSRARAQPVIEALTAGYPDLEVTQSTSPLMPDVMFVMQTVRGVNKGSAVELIAARADVALADVMFVGDGDNDVVALTRVGWSVAMGNGSEAARAAAKRQVGDVDDGAAADAFALALRS